MAPHLGVRFAEPEDGDPEIQSANRDGEPHPGECPAFSEIASRVRVSAEEKQSVVGKVPRLWSR